MVRIGDMDRVGVGVRVMVWIRLRIIVSVIPRLHDLAIIKQTSSRHRTDIEQTLSKHRAITAHVVHVYFECICWMFARWLLDHVNGVLALALTIIFLVRVKSLFGRLMLFLINIRIQSVVVITRQKANYSTTHLGLCKTGWRKWAKMIIASAKKLRKRLIF